MARTLPAYARWEWSRQADPTGGYAEALEEFLHWTSWDSQGGQLEFHGDLYAAVNPETEAEMRIALMVSFDRMCHKLAEMNAPLVSHPEFHMIADGHGFLKGQTTIRLYSVPG